MRKPAQNAAVACLDTDGVSRKMWLEHGVLTVWAVNPDAFRKKKIPMTVKIDSIRAGRADTMDEDSGG